MKSLSERQYRREMNLIFRILYRLYRLVSWFKYWVPRRFTRCGLGILVALAACAVMVPDTDNNLAYQAFTFLLVLLLISWCFCFFFKAQVAVERLLPRFGTAGSPLSYMLLVRNLTQRSQMGLTVLEDLADQRPGFKDWLAVQLADERRIRSFRFAHRRRRHQFKLASVNESSVPPLAPGRQAEAKIDLLPLRRGVLRLRGVTLARPDPLGLLRAFVKLPVPQQVLILPKRYPVPPVALPGAMKYQQGGVALAASVGQSEEFVSLREYRHGDPMRHIHWRSWAKAGKPVVKEFEDEFFVRHALVLDTFTDHPRGEAFEEAVAVAASFACTLQTQESLLDLLFVGTESYCFTAGRSLGNADQMLQILASVRACNDQPFSNLEHLVLNHVRLVSGCICILLAWDQPRREFVKKLRELGLPALVLVVLEPHQNRSIRPGPMSDQPGQFHVLEVGQIEQGLARLR
jgi:uncharacterized protein (DUF58 family)